MKKRTKPKPYPGHILIDGCEVKWCDIVAGLQTYYMAQFEERLRTIALNARHDRRLDELTLEQKRVDAQISKALRHTEPDNTPFNFAAYASRRAVFERLEKKRERLEAEYDRVFELRFGESLRRYDTAADRAAASESTEDAP